MIACVGRAVVATEWTDGLDVVPWAGIVGLMAGALLGWSVIGGMASHAIGVVYGLGWVGLLLAQQLPSRLSGREQIAELFGRLADWARIAVSGGTSTDPLIFVMLLAALFWILGYNAGWNTYRRLRVWRALIPIGATALVIAFYYIGEAPLMIYLALYLLFALLYVARTHLIEQEASWITERVSYDSELRQSVLLASAVVTAIVLSLAWVAPGAAAVPEMISSWRQFSRPMRTVEEEWRRLFANLYGSPAPRVIEPFGQTMALGGTRHMPDTLVMDVAAPRGARYYWRGAVYGTYEQNRWKTLEHERVPVSPGVEMSDMAVYELREPITQTVTHYLAGYRTLVGAFQLRSIDRSAEALVDAALDVPPDYIRLYSLIPLNAGDQYRSVSALSYVDKESLRAAGETYPEWITERYLQLPTALPERVGDLAEVVTAGAETPFDKTVALEQYLRRNIEYRLDPPPVPEGRDYVDFLLFESRQDYCNGYASALAVMARTIGIPARVAVGYAQGEYDPEQGVFRVRKEDAHSWPEVYFPRYGWLEFEPTAAQLPIVRPERPPEEGYPDDARVPPWMEQEFGLDLGRNLGLEDDPADSLAIESLDPERPLPFWIAWVVVGLAAVGGAGWWSLENAGFQGLLPVERAYARLQRYGRWVGNPPRPSDTPAEWAGSVIKSAPEARQPIGLIVDLYVRARFAHGDSADADADRAWREVRPALWRVLLRRVVPRWVLPSG
jgi:transglutaminase-like putative cysteine protease